MKIEEANKLIAEFMGVYSEENGYDYTEIGNRGVWYHTSWDWLMPVIVKLKQEVQFICFSPSQAQELVDDIDDSISYCQGILVTHECVVAFIKQLNQEKNKSNG